MVKTIIMVFMLAGMLYGLTGFMDAARIASVNANTGLNYESDAIAACVIGGISFVGGIGKVSGAIIGVLLLQLIFVGLNYLSVDQNLLYIVKGVIILVALLHRHEKVPGPQVMEELTPKGKPRSEIPSPHAGIVSECEDLRKKRWTRSSLAALSCSWC